MLVPLHVVDSHWRILILSLAQQNVVIVVVHVPTVSLGETAFLGKYLILRSCDLFNSHSIQIYSNSPHWAKEDAKLKTEHFLFAHIVYVVYYSTVYNEVWHAMSTDFQGYIDQILTCDVGVSLHSKTSPLFMKYSNGASTYIYRYLSLFPVLFSNLHLLHGTIN